MVTAPSERFSTSSLKRARLRPRRTSVTGSCSVTLSLVCWAAAGAASPTAHASRIANEKNARTAIVSPKSQSAPPIRVSDLGQNVAELRPAAMRELSGSAAQKPSCAPASEQRLCRGAASMQRPFAALLPCGASLQVDDEVVLLDRHGKRLGHVGALHQL